MKFSTYSIFAASYFSSQLVSALPQRRALLDLDSHVDGAADEVVETVTQWHTVWWTGGSETQTTPASSTATGLTAVDVRTTSSVVPTYSHVSSSASKAASSSQAKASTSSTLATSTVPTTTSSSAAASSTASSQNITIPFLRGVNLGGWLVLEKWMDSDAFTGDFANAVDQWTFDSISGASEALETHWSTYFTEDDIKTIAATGINALRIPIGYWAYDVTDGEPYIQGADAYLEKAIGWARDNGMYVWVDLHGSPGSQNGFDNSGHEGSVEWQETANLERSTSVLKTMAAKYGALEYADVVVGIEMVNEPISWGNNTLAISQSWAQTAYAAVKAASANQDLVIVMHDGFEGATAWTGVAEELDANRRFGVDTHLYQLYTDAYNALDQAEHITAACAWGTDLAIANAVMPTYVGEWSAATNICVNTDGTTTNGTSCTEDGCQCQSADFSDWNDNMIEQVRRFVEAQLDTFEASSSGWFVWAAKGPGGWGFLNDIDNGAFPNPVTSRKYPGQCGLTLRRAKRGELGLTPEAF